MPTLKTLYERRLAQDPNYASVLPPNRCPFDASAGGKLAQLLAREDAWDLAAVVVYPDDTYTVILDYRIREIVKVLKK